jgi:prepilin-type N-terminal cleavage/methylation domain-containing protein
MRSIHRSLFAPPGVRFASSASYETSPNEQRRGRTLLELLVALTVSGILFALLSTAFVGHSRLVAGTTAIAESRGRARQAQQIIPAVLASAAPAAADLYVVHDTLVEFGYVIGTGVACLVGTSSQLMLAPDSIAAGQRLASWTHTPRPGDLAHIYDAGPLLGASDDRWWTASVSGLAWVPNGCSGSALLDPVRDAGHRARVLSIAGWIGPAALTIPLGAVVRFSRRLRVLLYNSSGKDYLGVSDWDGALSRWSVLQPVSGPYTGSAGVPGIQFRLTDSLGGLLPYGPSPSGAALLSVTLRTRSATPVRIPGMRPGFRAESLTANVALRNR